MFVLNLIPDDSIMPNKQPDKAIALTYDGVNAPTVSAKGADEDAKKIIEIAKEFGIPIYENPQLLSALSQLEISDEIPENLYQVIAEVISFAYWIQGKKPD